MNEHFSYSQLSQYRLCPQRWYFQRTVEREPSTKAADYGKEVHRQIEDYLRYDILPEDPRTKAACLDLDLPCPATIEASFRVPIPGCKRPLIGSVDWHHRDRILDHKTKSDPKWCLTSYEISKDTQLLLYAKAIELCTGQEIKVVGHHYIVKTPGFSHYVEWADVFREDVERVWQEASEDFREMERILDGEISPEKNTGACYAFRRQCHFFEICEKTEGWGF